MKFGAVSGGFACPLRRGEQAEVFVIKEYGVSGKDLGPVPT